jgi:alpha-beta hydrolase superfamily lysophospholipase
LTGTEFILTAADGKNLYTKSWTPEKPLALVCLVHGLGEHVGRYEHVAQQLNRSGIAVYGIDLRGHGHSPGKKGHASCQDLWDDVESLMKHARLSHLDVPLFLYGHSWGGNIVSNFLLRRNSGEIRGAILSSPWLKLSFEPARMKLLMAQWLSGIYPSLTQANDLQPEHLSRDPRVGEAYIRDPLVHQKISAGLFSEAVLNGQYALEHASQLSKPLLIMHGTDDQITSAKASEEFSEIAPNARLQLWPDMRHETHNEYGKEEVVEFVCRWIVKNTL